VNSRSTQTIFLAQGRSLTNKFKNKQIQANSSVR
jgi:hypothetical protein